MTEPEQPTKTSKAAAPLNYATAESAQPRPSPLEWFIRCLLGFLLPIGLAIGLGSAVDDTNLGLFLFLTTNVLVAVVGLVWKPARPVLAGLLIFFGIISLCIFACAVSGVRFGV